MTKRKSYDVTGYSPAVTTKPMKPIEEFALSSPISMTTGSKSSSSSPSSSSLDEDRGQWSRGLEFLFSCISLSVGLGNVWRFPYAAYTNGGGAFLIPYLLLLFIIGRPLYYMEIALGQFSGKGPIKIWKCVPALKGIGFAQNATTAYVIIFYNYLMALSLYYLFASFQSPLPWTVCDKDWATNCDQTTNGSDSIASNSSGNSSASLTEQYWNNNVLRLSSGLDEITWINYKLVLCLILSWIIVYASIAKGIQSLGKVVYFTGIFPYVVLIALLIAGLTNEGAMKGLVYFFEPKWHKLWDPIVWYRAAEQSFFSLAVCFGSLPMYASYNSFKNNVYRDAIIISVMDTFTSILAGCVIFAVLGSMAFKQGKPIETVVENQGLGLAFVAYPEALSQLKFLPQLWSVSFFVMLYTLGLGSSVAQLEIILTCIRDEFKGMMKKKNLLAALACTFFCLCGLPLTTNIIFVYGNYQLFASDSPNEPGIPDWGNAVGWTLAAIAIFQIPLWIVITIYRKPGSFKQDERGQWSRGLEFLFSCISLSVGLGNVWRFPYAAYTNGGGAFLIPYLLLLFIIGRPLYYMEIALGQFSGKGPIKIWKCVPALKVYVSIAKGVQSLGKVVYFTGIFPYVVLIALLIAGLTNEGAMGGLIYFFEPKWHKLWDPIVWYRAAEQSFFSLAICFGSLPMYASYNSFKNNVYRDAIIISIMDTFTSILAGCVIFAVLGSMAFKQGKPIETVVEKQGLGLAFVAYPEALSQLKFLPQLWSVSFFVMLYTLGLGSSVAQLETILTCIRDEFKSMMKRKNLLAALGCTVFCLCGLPLTTNAGLYMISLLDNYGVGTAVFFYGICEVTGIMWIYGLNQFCADLQFMLGHPVGWFWKLTWAVITPFALVLIFVYGNYQLFASGGQNEPGIPDWGNVVGWTLAAIAIFQIPLWIIITIYKKPGSFKQKLVNAFSPTSDWGPSDTSHLKEYLNFKASQDSMAQAKYQTNPAAE
ncbi:Sodium- and chloride-dependent glycine transporter 2 [Halotydeus destructor]|nr:Sodium- and chloride-dependent glycine transporter 2 [Halotydeus destructor]